MKWGLATAMRPASYGYADVNGIRLVTAPELGPTIERFLTDSLTTPAGGKAAAASRASR